MFEAPAARFGVDRLEPVAAAADFLRQQPIDAPARSPDDRADRPLAARARSVIAVSQIGDLQGCRRSGASSSINSPSRCLWQYCELRRCRRDSPGT